MLQTEGPCVFDVFGRGYLSEVAVRLCVVIVVHVCRYVTILLSGHVQLTNAESQCCECQRINDAEQSKRARHALMLETDAAGDGAKKTVSHPVVGLWELVWLMGRGVVCALSLIHI